jgi:hypothetical protein
LVGVYIYDYILDNYVCSHVVMWTFYWLCYAFVQFCTKSINFCLLWQMTDTEILLYCIKPSLYMHFSPHTSNATGQISLRYQREPAPPPPVWLCHCVQYKWLYLDGHQTANFAVHIPCTFFEMKCVCFKNWSQVHIRPKKYLWFQFHIVKKLGSVGWKYIFFEFFFSWFWQIFIN